MDPVKSCFGAITISSTCFGWEYLTCFEIFRFNLIYEGEYWGQKSEVWFPESNERCESYKHIDNWIMENFGSVIDYRVITTEL